jgi:predicted ABC-type ATPase
MDWTIFNRRPIIVVLAGPNGAGKSTFYQSYLSLSDLPFVNADVIAKERNCAAYEAADLAEQQRQELLAQRESFIFETVFSDPVGNKLDFLVESMQAGYTVVLCFIRIANAELSLERVSMRAKQGGHDVPADKIETRFPRVLANLKRAIPALSSVSIFDNSDASKPHQFIASFEAGRLIEGTIPDWLQSLLDS